ncbi:MAG: methyl-accepting chemotaxis protein [Rhodocyclales bacterium GT-UBC]|nr:MAG: methyl-accepting chemotaxis protein [Rhodocyclales bacterium GT-UBC]
MHVAPMYYLGLILACAERPAFGAKNTNKAEEDMNIRQKLILLLVSSVIALLAVGGFGLRGILVEQSAIEDIGGNRMPSVIALLKIQEALTNISRSTYINLGISAGMPAEKKRSEIELSTQRKKNGRQVVESSVKQYEALPSDADEQRLWGQTKKELDGWLALEDKILAAEEKAIKSMTDEAFHALSVETREIIGQRRAMTAALTGNLQKVIDFNVSAGEKSYRQANEAAASAKWAEIVVFVLAVIGIVGMGFSILLAIMRPIRIAQDTVLQIAETNDLRKRVEYSGSDEIGHMVGALNQMLEKVRASMHHIQNNMSEVKDAVSSLNNASSEVASSSAAQSSAAASMAANIEELTVSINTVSDSAGDARRLATESADISEEGGQIIQRTVDEMGTISSMVTRASEVIESLGRDAEKISAVVQVIKDVADQTNLLALNAAIEAARAGEQGRGFAVVADEVRKLAERTTQSTLDIGTMVNAIQASAGQAVSEMQVVVEQVAQGQTLANDAGSRMNNIRQSAQRVTAAIVDISSALKEQSMASHDIARHVESIAQMTDENHAAAENTAESAQRLDALSHEVAGVIGSFRV